MVKISFIIPDVKTKEQCLKSILNVIREKTDEIEILFPAKTLNQLVNQCKGKWFVVLQQSDLEIKPEFIDKVVSVIDNKTAMVYTDYAISDENGNITKENKLYDYNDNFTERFDFGILQVYNTNLVKKIGGFRTKFNYPIAAEYDLRLRLFEKKYKFTHLNEVLYKQITAGKEDSKLFAAFKYLQYDKKEEKEIETAFYEFLKRNNAYLSHKNPKVEYKPDEKFNPLVSVVSPTFNREKWIGKAIDSLRAQTFKDWEAVFVDNASTDRTAEIIREYSQKDSRIRLVQLKEYKDGAIAYCLNRGISAAKGKYYAQLDSDDEYAPDTLETVVKYMESHPTVGLGISYYDLIDETSQVLKQVDVIKHLEFNRNNILRCEGGGALRVWHRKVWLEFGGFDEKDFGSFGEDYDLLLKTSEKYDVGRIHKILYHYRRHSEVTDMVRDPMLKVRNKTLARLRAFQRRVALNVKRKE